MRFAVVSLTFGVHAVGSVTVAQFAYLCWSGEEDCAQSQCMADFRRIDWHSQPLARTSTASSTRLQSE